MEREAGTAPARAVDYIGETRRTYDALGYPAYRWVRNDDPPPFAPLRKPMAEARLGLIASGGIYRAGQIAFHYRDDASYRVIPADVDSGELRATHFAYDLRDARQDINVVFPIDRLRELVESGEVGELAPESLTFMGGIYSARAVRDELAPAMAERLAAHDVDAVLAVPV